MTDLDYNTPQYSKTTDAAVFEALGEIQESESVFFEYVKRLSHQLTGAEGNVYHSGDKLTGRKVVGVRASSVGDLPGQWKKPSGGVLEPFKNNPIREEWAKHRHPYIPVPGRREVERGARRMGPGTLFIQDGVAYSGYGFMSQDRAPAGADVWEEIKASEFMAAMEAHNEQIEREDAA